MSVSGELRVGLIRCTGRYDNISFIIKTPFPSHYIYILYIEYNNNILITMECLFFQKRNSQGLLLNKEITHALIHGSTH